MMQSGLYSLASSGLISGSGLAIAKITGSLAKLLTICSVNYFAAETPMRTSVPTAISSKDVSLVIVRLDSAFLKSFIPFDLPSHKTP
jgi:ABC-type phosphate transport system permease subunit